MNETPRRIARTDEAMRAAIGRPTVFAPAPRTVTIVRSPFTVRAMAGQLPAKELGR